MLFPLRTGGQPIGREGARVIATRLLSRDEFEAIRRSVAKDGHLARRLGLPIELVECVRRSATLREAIDDYVPRGTRVRLAEPMASGFAWEPRVGEWGTADGADDGGKLFVLWDRGANLALLATDRFECGAMELSKR